MISGLNPLGTKQTDKKGFELLYWKADKDVTLSDGTKIKAGEKIETAQIAKIVVSENIKLTAIHKKLPAAPDTGAFTGSTNATLISISVIGVLGGALLIALLPKLTHKKVNFKK